MGNSARVSACRCLCQCLLCLGSFQHVVFVVAPVPLIVFRVSVPLCLNVIVQLLRGIKVCKQKPKRVECTRSHFGQFERDFRAHANMSSPIHDWERPWDILPDAPADSDDDHPNWNDSDDETHGQSEISKQEAGVLLARLLTEYWYKGVISAKQCCILAYWCHKAGAQGPVGDLSFRLDAPTGHYQRHLETVLQLRHHDERLYSMQIPGYDKKHAARCKIDVQISPLHESLQEEAAANPSIAEEVRRLKCEGKMPAQYTNHPVVRSAPPETVVIPYSLYLDAFPYTKHDSCLGITVYNEVTEKRHLVASLRKGELCKCGCKMWDSLVHIFWAIAWSIEWAARGVFPRCRHDGTEFGSGDELRAGNASLPMGYRFALTYLKGDWMEYCTSLGLVNWSSVLHPCFCCFTPHSGQYDVAGFGPGAFPHQLKNMEDYDAACRACEVRVQVTQQVQLDAIRPLLYFDARKNGGRGRCLSGNIDALGLRTGDRLEPNPLLRDPADFEELTAPCEILWWRPSNDTWVRRRCPLFSDDYGVGVQSLIVDILHCLHLGVLQKYVVYCWWRLIEHNAWQVPATNEEELFIFSVHRLRADLFGWYPAYRRARPEEMNTMTELPDVTPKTLGPKGAYLLKTKAAMTRPLVPFTVDLLKKMLPNNIPGQSGLQAAGESLDRLLVLLRQSPRVPNSSTTQDLRRQTLGEVCGCKRGEVHAVTKCDMLFDAHPGIHTHHTIGFVRALTKELHDICKRFLRIVNHIPGYPRTGKVHLMLHMIGRRL